MQRAQFAFWLAFAAAGAAQASEVFTAIAPCRVADTRFGGGIMAAGETRHFEVSGTDGFPAQGGTTGGCGIPQDAGVTAVAFNFVAVGPVGPGHIEAWAFGGAVPVASTINYSAQADTGGLNIANGVIVPIVGTSASDKDLSVRANFAATHVVIDVTGYFSTLVITGGDITGVAAGTGLEGGGTSGDVSLGILGTYQLPQGCSDGQVAVKTGSTWTCGGNAGGGGFGFSKADIVRYETAVQVDGGGDIETVSVSCADGNDIPLEAFCRPTPGNPTDGGFRYVSYTGDLSDHNTANPATLTCKFHNDNPDVTPSGKHNCQAVLYCILVPGP